MMRLIGWGVAGGGESERPDKEGSQ